MTDTNSSIIPLLVIGASVIVIILLPKVFRKKVLLGLGLLAILLLFWDLVNYSIIQVRQNNIRKEFKPGMTISQTTSWMERNKKRLHIAKWRYDATTMGYFLFIFIDAPSSIIALVSESESAWYFMVTLDPETKTFNGLKK